jgi:hypothetical protein
MGIAHFPVSPHNDGHEGGVTMLIQTDSRRRITIPPRAGVMPGDTLDLEILPDGRMLLVPVATIPKHQLWAFSPEIRAIAAESIADSRPSKVIETQEDIDEIAGRWEDED